MATRYFAVLGLFQFFNHPVMSSSGNKFRLPGLDFFLLCVTIVLAEHFGVPSFLQFQLISFNWVFNKIEVTLFVCLCLDLLCYTVTITSQPSLTQEPF